MSIKGKRRMVDAAMTELAALSFSQQVPIFFLFLTDRYVHQLMHTYYMLCMC